MKAVCKLRPMVLEDLEGVVALENKCFAQPWSDEAFYKELTENKLAHYAVVLLEDKIVAYGGAWYIMDEGHITNVGVDPDYRQQGLGQTLVAFMKDQAIEAHLKQMTLEVRKSNVAAIKLYEKMDFVVMGTRPKYYTDNQEDALIMWLTLDRSEDEHEGY